jgi:transposase-like protein
VADGKTMEWQSKLLGRYQRRTVCLEDAGDRLFAFTHLPPSQWKSAQTANAIERLHPEFKRRIKTQIVLPSSETAGGLASLQTDQHA